MNRILTVLALFAAISSAYAQVPERGASVPANPQGASLTLPYYLQDRGPGMATSLFGSYVKEKELLVYKLNNAVGLTPDAPTWAPEIGLMMSF